MPEQPVTVIAELEKNKREIVRVSLTEYGGYKLIDIRTFYEDLKTGQRCPGRSGISMRRELLTDLRKALQAAERAVKAEETDGDAAAAA